ncbi:MAG TPA: hypothetical protein VL574_06295 [Stellaceae bacterium]|nr:hypothetical protein [Stellaceae bacterium]
MKRPFAATNIVIHNDNIYVPTRIEIQTGTGFGLNVKPITIIPFNKIEELHQTIPELIEAGQPEIVEDPLDTDGDAMLRATEIPSWQEFYTQIQGLWVLSIMLGRDVFTIEETGRKQSAYHRLPPPEIGATLTIEEAKQISPDLFEEPYTEAFAPGTPVETVVARLIELIRAHATETA